MAGTLGAALADLASTAAGGLLVVSVLAYMGNAFPGPVVAAAVLIAGCPEGIVAHYLAYGQAGEAGAQSTGGKKQQEQGKRD